MNNKNMINQGVPCEKVRMFDRFVVEKLKMPSILLMENAGRSLVDALLPCLPNPAALNQGRRTAPGQISPIVLLCCGKGNNGGDGFVMARRLSLLGIPLEVMVVGQKEDYKGDAAVNLEILRQIQPINNRLWFFDITNPDILNQSKERLVKSLKNTQWVVDALLGTGAVGNLKPPYDTIVKLINESRKPVFAVDIPTGLNGNTGEAQEGQTIQAKVTCTLAAVKTGLIQVKAQKYVGDLRCGDIGVPFF